MGMQILRSFVVKSGGPAPIAHSSGLPAERAYFSGRICVLAKQGPGGVVSRADKLYLCEDARLVATELNSEWPSVKHWAAPATTDEIKAHPTHAARLIRLIAQERS
jgi:hypothetical protein